MSRIAGEKRSTNAAARLRLLCALASLALLPAPARSIAQDIIPLQVIVDAAAEVTDDTGPGKEEAPADWFKIEKEYRSGAVPGEEAELRSRIELARERFKAGEWAAGQTLLDEVLARVASAGYRKQRLLDIARRHRERESTLAEAEENPSQRIRATGADVIAPQELAGDLRILTTEVYSSDHIRYLPIADALRELLLAMPEEARAAYRSTYEAPARQALAGAS